MDSGDAPSLPTRPKTAVKTPPPAAPSPDAAQIQEQARMLKEYEDQQKALQSAREAEERRRLELEAQQQAEFEQRQREQAERERLAQEQLMQQQMQQYNNQAAQQAADIERQMLAMRGQYERDQLLLEQYDRVSFIRELIFPILNYSLARQSTRGRTRWRQHPYQRPDRIQGRID